MTTIAPVRAWWRVWLRFYFGWLGPRLAKRGLRSLTKLSIVNAARWSLIEREPGTPRGGDGRFPKGYLLFEANFNGNTDAYLESFAMVSRGGLVAAWGAFGKGAYDVPSPWKVSRFITYVNDNRSRILHHYCAYPHASTKVVRTALRLQELLAEFQAQAHRADTARFNRAWETLLTRVEEINNPPAPRRNGSTSSFTAMTPIKPVPLDEMRTAFEVLEHEPEHVPPTTHFARWAFVDGLKPPPGMKRDPTSYLIFSAWFDGPVKEYLLDLHDRLGSTRVKQIWGPCGFAGAGPEQLQRFLRHHIVRQGLPILAYDGVSVEAVLWALKMANRFDEASVELQALRGDDLRAKLRQKGLLE